MNHYYITLIRQVHNGTSGIYKLKSGIKYSWNLNNKDFRIIERLQRYCSDVWEDINFKIMDVRESSHVYRVSACIKKMANEFEEFYTQAKEKCVPDYILNETLEHRKWFFIGFYAADGNKTDKWQKISFSQKHKITMSGLNDLLQSLGWNTCIGMRDDKFNIFHLHTVTKQSDVKVHKIIDLGTSSDYVYDIETESHDFNCGFPLIVHNSDSFVISVKPKTENVTQDLKSLSNHLDFSNLNSSHELYSNENKKVLGKFKIETPNSVFIEEFIALRSKCYAFKCEDNDENSNKFKGVQKHQTSKLTFNDYKHCLLSGEEGKKVENFTIKSIKHEMFLQSVTKKSLSSWDTKRKYLDAINSEPW